MTETLVRRSRTATSHQGASESLLTVLSLLTPPQPPATTTLFCSTSSFTTFCSSQETNSSFPHYDEADWFLRTERRLKTMQTGVFQVGRAEPSGIRLFGDVKLLHQPFCSFDFLSLVQSLVGTAPPALLLLLFMSRTPPHSAHQPSLTPPPRGAQSIIPIDQSPTKKREKESAAAAPSKCFCR